MADEQDAGMALAQLRHKYDPAVKAMHQLGVQVNKIELQGGKLLIQADAPSEEVKNKVWTEIKRVDSGYGDLVADIRVTAPAGQGGPAGAATAPLQTYTVESGDTLSKISKKYYGDANEYMRIFEANKDTLDDPDKIQPGQVLRIPAK